jgi:site-specific DNA recombinase
LNIIKFAISIKEFNVDLFFRTTEKMTVFEGQKVVVSLLEGTEIGVAKSLDYLFLYGI